MQISEEMEKRQREAAKGIMEEPKDPFKDDYFEHLERKTDMSVDKVATNEERSHSSKDTKALNAKYIIETLDQELKEEMSQQLKDIK